VQTRRLAKFAPEDLDDEQRELYRAIAEGPRAQGRQRFSLADETGALEGPFNAMLLSPAVGQALQALGASVRYGGQLSDRAREIAILTVAQVWDSAFERYAHEGVARSKGVSDAELADLRAGAVDAFTDPTELAVARTTLALAARGDLDDEEYEYAVQALGTRVLFELTTLVGYYATLALQLRVFRVSLPEGADE
jgi:4-carboxymuconolactone decarboxylase